MCRSYVCVIQSCLQSKVHIKQIFYSLIEKSFHDDEERNLFYCDSTLGC